MSSTKRTSFNRRFHKFERDFSDALRVTEYLLLRALLFLGFFYGVYELVRQIFGR
jgi:hypothetical protein